MFVDSIERCSFTGNADDGQWHSYAVKDISLEYDARIDIVGKALSGAKEGFTRVTFIDADGQTTLRHARPPTILNRTNASEREWYLPTGARISDSSQRVGVYINKHGKRVFISRK